MKGILGRKLGMTQVFTEDGVMIPVTVVEATPNIVLQKKTVENDGYEAVQIGFEDVKEAGHAPEMFVRSGQREPDSAGDDAHHDKVPPRRVAVDVDDLVQDFDGGSAMAERAAPA